MSTLQNAVTTSSAPPTATESTFSRPEAIPPWRNPTQFERPSYLLSFPFSFSTEFANNPWMQDLPSDRRLPNFKRASIQFLELYRYLSGEALIYVLPTPQTAQLQDLVFTANLGVVLDHMADKNIVIISNFTSEPRRGETQVGVEFFQQMGYVALYTLLALGLGIVAALVLARAIKRATFNLEPAEIVALVQEREAMLYGIREGVLAVDTLGRVNVLNQEARRLLAVPGAQLGQPRDRRVRPKVDLGRR